MPIKFSALTEKTLNSSSYVVGLYNDSSITSTGKNNCIISSSQFAKSTDITSLTQTITEKDNNAVHKTGAESIYGDKTFNNKVTANSLVISTNGTTTKPSASNSTSLTTIPTIGWVNDPTYSTNVVHRTGNETLTGTKTFKSTDMKVGYITGYNATDTAIYNLQMYDSSNNNRGLLQNWLGANSQTATLIRAKNTSGANADIQVWIDNSGNQWTSAPNPTSPTDRTTKIATTYWVNDRLDYRIPEMMNTPRDSKVLWTGPLGAGDITLSEAFTNFEQLVIIGGNDSQQYNFPEIWSTYWLNYMLSQSYNPTSIWNCGTNNYWAIYNYSGGSSTTYFKSYKENSVLQKIFGINRKR